MRLLCTICRDDHGFETVARTLGCNGETLYCERCAEEYEACRDCRRPTSYRIVPVERPGCVEERD